MVKTRIPAKFRLDPIRDIQVLCPMNRGSLGIRELNVRLQAELNPARPDEPVVEKFGWQFRLRDKVIQTENNYDKDVFNGDIGQIVKIDPVEREVTCGSTSARGCLRFRGAGRSGAGLRHHHPQIAGVGVPGGGHPAGDAAIPAAAAEPGLHRHHAGQEAGGARRPAEGAGVAVRNNKTAQRFSGLLARLCISLSGTHPLAGLVRAANFTRELYRKSSSK